MTGTASPPVQLISHNRINSINWQSFKIKINHVHTGANIIYNTRYTAEYLEIYYLYACHIGLQYDNS